MTRRDSPGPPVASVAGGGPGTLPAHQWDPYVPHSPRMRITATSCCGEYELCPEGGEYLVLSPAEDGHEETARRRFAHATQVWEALTPQHSCIAHQGHMRRRR